MHDIDIFINDKWRKYTSGDSSKLQGDFNFAFDQRESEVNLHKETSSPKSPSNMSPALKHTKGYTYHISVFNALRYYRAFNKWVLSQGKFNQDMYE